MQWFTYALGVTSRNDIENACSSAGFSHYSPEMPFYFGYQDSAGRLVQVGPEGIEDKVYIGIPDGGAIAVEESLREVAGQIGLSI